MNQPFSPTDDIAVANLGCFDVGMEVGKTVGVADVASEAAVVSVPDSGAASGAAVESVTDSVAAAEFPSGVLAECDIL